MKELRKDLESYIWESHLQKQTRLEEVFDVPSQSTLSYVHYRQRFQELPMDMDDVGIEKLGPESTLRKYVSKLNVEHQVELSRREFKFDGVDKPSRS